MLLFLYKKERRRRRRRRRREKRGIKEKLIKIRRSNRSQRQKRRQSERNEKSREARKARETIKEKSEDGTNITPCQHLVTCEALRGAFKNSRVLLKTALTSSSAFERGKKNLTKRVAATNPNLSTPSRYSPRHLSVKIDETCMRRRFFDVVDRENILLACV